MHYVRFRHFKTSNVSSHLRFSLTRWNRYRNGVHRNNGGRPSLHVTTRRTRAQMHTRQVVSTSIRLNGKNKKKKKTKMKERRKYGGIKRAVHLPKLVRVAVIRTSRAYCALNRSVPFAPISNIHIYICTNLINGNFDELY